MSVSKEDLEDERLEFSEISLVETDHVPSAEKVQEALQNAEYSVVDLPVTIDRFWRNDSSTLVLRVHSSAHFENMSFLALAIGRFRPDELDFWWTDEGNVVFRLRWSN